MAKIAKHIIVHGRVQGVGFRYFVQHWANRLGLTGDVRNCPDYSVEIHVEGPQKKVDEFLKEMEKGPSLSRVERVDVHDTPVTDDQSSFTIEGW
jgi:acylphosphatase